LFHKVKTTYKNKNQNMSAQKINTKNQNPNLVYNRTVQTYLPYKDCYSGGRMPFISHKLYKESMASVKHEIEMKNLQSNKRHMKHIPKGNRRATGKK
jgi:hypothetical protein